MRSVGTEPLVIRATHFVALSSCVLFLANLLFEEFDPSAMVMPTMPAIKHLECSRCNATVSAETPQTLCPECKGALYVRYDLNSLHGIGARHAIVQGAANPPWSGMWRYRSVLPTVEPVTLGEGWTPMLRSRRYPSVFLKEEGANPTGSFKARGLALAVTMARHYGLRKLAVPMAGNAAGALAAYCRSGHRSSYFHAA